MLIIEIIIVDFIIYTKIVIIFKYFLKFIINFYINFYLNIFY